MNPKLAGILASLRPAAAYGAVALGLSQLQKMADEMSSTAAEAQQVAQQSLAVIQERNAELLRLEAEIEAARRELDELQAKTNALRELDEPEPDDCGHDHLVKGCPTCYPQTPATTPDEPEPFDDGSCVTDYENRND